MVNSIIGLTTVGFKLNWRIRELQIRVILLVLVLPVLIGCIPYVFLLGSAGAVLVSLSFTL